MFKTSKITNPFTGTPADDAVVVVDAVEVKRTSVKIYALYYFNTDATCKPFGKENFIIQDYLPKMPGQESASENPAFPKFTSDPEAQNAFLEAESYLRGLEAFSDATDVGAE